MTAVISDDGLYRYELTRDLPGRWAGGNAPPPVMCFVMLNPSTADGTQDDPTIRRCKSFAEREGCRTLEVVNLYAYRATKPKDLWDAAAAGIDAVGPENATWVDRAIRLRSLGANCLVAAWGANVEPSAVEWFAALVAAFARTRTAYDPPRVWCLGRTKGGQPRHPLMLRADTPLEPWDDWAEVSQR